MKKAKKTKKIRKTIKRYKLACITAWEAWKSAGNEPTRNIALRTLAKKVIALGDTSTLSKELVALSTAQDQEGGGGLNSSLSLIVWDLTQNKGRLLNYNTTSNFFNGLLKQAREILYTSSVSSVKIGKIRVQVPTVKFIKGKGATSLGEIPEDQFNALIAADMAKIKAIVARWKIIGANLSFVQGKIAELYEEATKVFV